MVRTLNDHIRPGKIIYFLFMIQLTATCQGMCFYNLSDNLYLKKNTYVSNAILNKYSMFNLSFSLYMLPVIHRDWFSVNSLQQDDIVYVPQGSAKLLSSIQDYLRSWWLQSCHKLIKTLTLYNAVLDCLKRNTNMSSKKQYLSSFVGKNNLVLYVAISPQSSSTD